MSSVLDKINDPNDIHNLSADERSILADELRSEIILRVSQNGGHLSSNLGVVELTIALMTQFDFHENQIVWDVGHQSYSYKLLTGRKDMFSTLRMYNGMSGFPRRAESPFDFFDTGHSSTSISGALGLLRAKRISGEKGRVIAVIGDGALTGGMAYEALNDAGQYDENLIIILNDNQMSIDKNVGALSRHLANLRSSIKYIKIKTKAKEVIRRIPLIGRPLFRMISVMKASIRQVIRRNHPVIFEDLGFHYYGPVDGHNISALMNYLDMIKRIKGPVLLHVCTQKGKGYEYAEAKPSQYHGVAPFDIEEGCAECQIHSFTTTFGSALQEIGRRNEKVVSVCAAMRSSSGLDGFADEFKNRFFDVGIAEEHALTMSAGLAANEIIPVVSLYSTFIQRGYDQILHDICLQNLHVVLAIDRAGIVGADGETHQGIYDMAMLIPMPNICILAPRDYKEMVRMLEYAVFDAKGPIAIRYPRAAERHIDVTKDVSDITFPQELRSGEDVVIFSVGYMAAEACLASDKLGNLGITCKVIDLRQVKPLHAGYILEETSHAKMSICCEDGVVMGGVGTQIARILLENQCHTPYFCVGISDNPVPAGTRADLWKREKMDSDSIVSLCSKVIGNHI